MSEPKFQVGQHVGLAYLSGVDGKHSPTTFIPETRIQSIHGPYRQGESLSPQVFGCAHTPGFFYWTESGHFAAERLLRPINPETEYQDQPQTTEVPDTQETVTP